MENSAVTERRDYFTYTVFIFTNSLIPIGESSRPYPLILIPPKGNRGSDRTYSFTKQQPASSFSAAIFRPLRSEERRVGKECSVWCGPEPEREMSMYQCVVA